VLAQDMLSEPLSQVYIENFFLCVQVADLMMPKLHEKIVRNVSENE